jgi:osmoprotectant transport system ATP-binding protein
VSAAPEPSPMLELRAVTKRFGARAALSAVSLSVARGETAVLLGLSGSGKSTVLRLLIGLLLPDAGEVLFGGQRVGAGNALAIRRRTGYVIQDGGLFAHLTAHGNVALMPRYLGWSEPRIRERLDALCELLRLPPARLASFPAQLSGGERQRVSVMRALVLDPDVLLLDEPLGALDPITRADLQHELRAIFHSLRKTVLLVTHDLDEAAHFGDSVALMRDGAIVQRGSLDDLRERPADDFARRFVSAQDRPRSARGPAR